MKEFLNCVCCGKSVTIKTSQTHRANKTSTLIQRYCFKCLDDNILKSSKWKMPYSEYDFDTYVRMDNNDK